MNTGDKVITAVETFLKEKLNRSDVTFTELYNLTNKKIQICVTNFTKSQGEIFSLENTPNVSVILAIRMSIAVPFFFTPVEYNNCIYVDGGLTNNFPIHNCNKETTLGLVIINNTENQFNSLPNYLVGLCAIAIDSLSLNFLRSVEDFKINYNYIEINCKRREGLNFKINKESVNQFLEDGESQAKKYYRNFIVKDLINELIDKTINLNTN